MRKIIRFNKINFIKFKIDDFKNIIKKGGLFLFPSGPGLSSIDAQTEYYNSLKKADYVFFDSGYFVLLLRVFKGIEVKKFSGYKFLEIFFEYLKKNKNLVIFSIDPNKSFLKSNKKFLNNLGLKNFYNYLAPKYHRKNLKDSKLLKRLNSLKPDYIVINIGGGIQEILGLYLKEKLRFKTTIICTGAAISFYTGDQAPIGNKMDKLFLGWLVRIIYDPKIYLMRYIKAIKLIKIFFKYKNTIQIKNNNEN